MDEKKAEGTEGHLSSQNEMATQESRRDDPPVVHPTDDSDSDLSSCEEFDFISSQWENGVETGLQLNWPGSHRTITLNTKLTEDRIAPLFHGTQWAGTRVWKAAVVALEYLLETYPNGGSLLELGCGLGVPGMLWHLLHEQATSGQACDEGDNNECKFPPRVVMTDMPDLLPQLKDNVKDNFAKYYGKSIEAKDLDWSTEGLRELWNDEANLRSTRSDNVNHRKMLFDVCLNCDCIYEPLYGRDSWEALADVLAEVARQSPGTVLVSSVERRSGDGLEDFIQRLEATGVVESMKMVARNDGDPHHVIEIYVTRGNRLAVS